MPESKNQPPPTLAISDVDWRDGDKAACRDFYGYIGFCLQMELVEVSHGCGGTWAGTLKDKQGRCIYLLPHWQKHERLTISGNWPRTKDGQYAADRYDNKHNPEITVSITREPGVIAKEIQRRFLPEFIQRWNEIAARVKQTDEYEDKKQANRDQLAQRIDGARLVDHVSSSVWVPSPWHECQVSADSVSLGVRYVPMELAVQIIDVVEAWRREHSEDE